MSVSHPQSDANPLLLSLIDLSRRARTAAGIEELGFLLVNDTRLLVAYRQATLWFEADGIVALSGVVQPESNAPYAQWLNQVCKALSVRNGTAPLRVSADALPAELAAEWQEWMPAQALWFPIAASPDHPGSSPGGLLLAGDAAFAEESTVILGEWVDTWRHAWLARFRTPVWKRWGTAAHGGRHGSQGRRWLRRAIVLAAVVLLLLLVPVRLTVLAPAELVPAKPAVIRAPLDGVIGSFQVRPNEAVKAGQPLFSFDDAPLTSRLGVARQGLATAQAEYRQAAQLALVDPRSKAQLAALIGKMGEKRAESEFLAGQFKRSQVVAPRDGIVIFDDPSEWIGRPVQTGERIMRVADPHDVEIEAWVLIADAIPLAEGAEVHLYLAASPFAPVTAKLRYISHDASPRPEGVYAYRARATLAAPTEHRVGLKGTAKLYGREVSLGYWILRAPLAMIRQFLAM